MIRKKSNPCEVISDPSKAHELLLAGIREGYELVSRTYGPGGGPVLIEKQGVPFATTDGVSVLREAQLGDKRRIGLALVREAARETESLTGDGTTTTVLMTSSLSSALIRRIAEAGSNPPQIVREVQEASKIAVERIALLSEEATQVDLAAIALSASHGDQEISDRVVEAVMTVGEEGAITLAAYEGTGVVLEYREGMEVPQGWASYEMAPRDGASERELEGPFVVVSLAPLKTMGDVVPMMESATQWPGRGLVVFAPQIYGEALATMVTNDRGGVLPCIAVEHGGSPRDLRGWAEDLATVTNATVLDPVADMGPGSFRDEYLGYARKVTVARGKTAVFSYLDDDIAKRIDAAVVRLRAESDDCPYPYERDRLKERLAALDGGLCVLKVGGFTKQEAQNRRGKAEDAVQAVQQALRGGVVPGAGWALFLASTYLPDTVGGKILAKALREPLRTLATQAGLEPAGTLLTAKQIAFDSHSPWLGLDPVARDWRNLRDSPVIVDAKEVLLAAVTNAVSVACQVALVGGVIKRRD
jgi:chaperonin GroEL